MFSLSCCCRFCVNRPILLSFCFRAILSDWLLSSRLTSISATLITQNSFVQKSTAFLLTHHISIQRFVAVTAWFLVQSVLDKQARQFFKSWQNYISADSETGNHIPTLLKLQIFIPGLLLHFSRPVSLAKFPFNSHNFFLIFHISAIKTTQLLQGTITVFPNSLSSFLSV